MITLKQALKEGKLKQFIKERLADKPGDQEQFDKVISSMVQKSPEAPKASPKGSRES